MLVLSSGESVPHLLVQKLISVVTPLSLPSFSVGAPIFLWAILSNRRVLLLVLLGCTVRSTGNG